MYFLIVATNLLFWWDFGFPANIIIPALWVGSIAMEMYLQFTFAGEKHKRRILFYMAFVMCLICEACLWLISSSIATAFYISYHMAAAVFVASLIGKLGFMLMERAQKNRQD